MVRMPYMDLYAGGNIWEDELVPEELPNSSKRDEENLQDLDIPGSFMYPRRGHNHPQVSSEVILNQTNGSTVQASQSSITSDAPILRRCVSSLSETERVARKRKTDQEYRKREKNKKVQMQSDLENLSGVCDALNGENQSLKEVNASMKQKLTNQAKEMDQLRCANLQLKRDLCKQNVLMHSLSEHLAVASWLEIKKLKNEIAWLRKNANPNSDQLQLLEENAKLKAEIKVLKVQNDALCGKMISDK